MSAAEQLELGGTSNPEVSRRRPRASVLIVQALKKAGGALLVEELARATHLPLSSVAARVGEMVRRSALLPAELRTTRAGRRAWAFALPASLSAEKRRQAGRWAVHVVANRGRWVPSSGDQPATGEILGT